MDVFVTTPRFNWRVAERVVELRRTSVEERPFTPSPQQKEVIAHRKSPLIVRGGAGSGKTRTLIECAVSRIKGGQDPDSILFLTYGRERASEVRDQIAQYTGATMREPLARTFHALAFSILKMDYNPNSDGLDPILLSGAEQESLIRELIDGITERVGEGFWPSDLHKALKTEGFVREVRDLMLRSSERGLNYVELAKEGKKFAEPFWIAVSKFWAEYENVRSLRESNTADAKLRLDPSEIIGSAIALLKRDTKLLNELRTRFKTIIVDEFQESDPLQRQLLELLAGEELIIAVDSASAVGRFRGADPDGVESALAPDRSRGKSIELTTPQRGDVTPETYLFRSQSEEAQYIAHRFKRAHLMDGVSYSQMAVILRSPGSLASALRRAFIQSGIPVVGYLDVLGKNPALAPFLLLARVATGDQQLTVQTCVQLLLAEFGGADSISIRRIRRSLLLNRKSGDERTGNQLLIDAIDRGEIFIEESSALIRVHELLETARRSARRKNVTAEELLWSIWDNAKNSRNEKIADSWRNEALRNSSRSVVADRDLDAMIQLFDEAARFSERMTYAKPSLFLRQIAQEDIAADIITSKGVRPEAVEILTVHAAKGREWEIVAVAGVQDGIWPNLKQRSSLLGAERLVEHLRYPDIPKEELRSIAAAGLAEDEARLLHVAITRARKECMVSAVSDEEEIPSTYFENLVESRVRISDVSKESVAEATGESAQESLHEITYTTPPRQLSQAALVAELRRVLQSNEGEIVSNLVISQSDHDLAASLLKKLSDEGIAPASPSNWTGYRTISTSLPVVDEGDLVPVSPSGGETFEDCGLKWFLERQGGSNGETTAQLLGTVIHEFARIKSEDPTISTDDLYQRMGKAWKVIDTNTGWVSRSGLAKAIAMIDRFIEYHDTNLQSRKVLAVEARFEMEIGRALVRGSADRIEVTRDGELFIIDFKTGKTAIKVKDTADNLQLAAYQLAAILRKYKANFESNSVIGAELTYLAVDKAEGTTIRKQNALTPEGQKVVEERLNEIADGMGAATFIARVNDKCRKCGVASSCPLQSQGRTVIS